jgi:16S rRNA processing protein RimM
VIRQIEELLNNSVPVVRLLGPHGLNGEIKGKILANYVDIFVEGKEYFLYHPRKKSNLRVTLEGFRITGTRMNVKFKNYDRIEWAKKLEGYEIYLSLKDLPPLRDGEYYFFQLFGSKVLDNEGIELGTVEDVIETGNADVLSIRKPSFTVGDPAKDSELLVPMIKEYIISMDLTKKVIIINVPKYTGTTDENEENV